MPLIRDGELLGVLDIDSPKPGRFTPEDEAGVVRLGEILSRVALAQLFQPLVADRPGDDHHRAGQHAGIRAREIGDQRPRAPAWRGTQH